MLAAACLANAANADPIIGTWVGTGGFSYAQARWAPALLLLLDELGLQAGRQNLIGAVE